MGYILYRRHGLHIFTSYWYKWILSWVEEMSFLAIVANIIMAASQVGDIEVSQAEEFECVTGGPIQRTRAMSDPRQKSTLGFLTARFKAHSQKNGSWLDESHNRQTGLW